MSEYLRLMEKAEEAEKAKAPPPTPAPKKVKPTPTPRKKKPKVDILIFDEALLWCRDEKHKNLPTVKTFLKHCDPDRSKERGGGGWIGGAKALIQIQQMIQKEQEEE
jgi:hypothetical protein